MAEEKVTAGTIALNKKARHDYFIDERYEAGLALQGWEVKALRAGRLQLKEGYVLLKDGEAFLFGSHISPLPTTSTHVIADPTRIFYDRGALVDRAIGTVSKALGSVGGGSA